MAFSERLGVADFSFLEAEHLHRYAIAKHFCADKHVLDIASGEGYGSSLIAIAAKSVVGVDIDELSVTNANDKYATKKKNLKFIQGSLTKIPLPDNSVDVITSFESIEHISEHEIAFLEFKRVLKSNGVLIISTPDKYYYTDTSGKKNPYHIKEFYRSDFANILNKFFLNSVVLQQKYMCGSLLRPYSDVEKYSFKLYSGDFNSVELNRNDDGLYMFAFASDTESKFEDFSLSFFDLTDLIEDTNKRRLEQVYGSTSYKIGKRIVDFVRLFYKK